MNIPMSQVFGTKFENEELQSRGSFYLELNPDSIIIEKLSVARIDCDSIVSQERPVDKIYSSTDWKWYLEDFDFERDPEEEIFIQEQIKCYREQYKSENRHNKDETKWSETDCNEENEWEDTDESTINTVNTINAYKLKPSIISERMCSFGIEKKTHRNFITSILTDNRKAAELISEK